MLIAAIGCGSIGRRHLRNLLTLGCRELIAFDQDPEAREGVKQELGIEVYRELEEIWARKPDAVVIATPTQYHLDLALQAVARGCHMFVEKPLAHTLEGIDTLCGEVEKRGLVTMVGCNMRFHPGPAMVKRLIEEKAVGEVIAARIQTGSYLPDWRPHQDYHQSYSASAVWGGAILDCIHEIDLALWYFGPAGLIGAAWLPAAVIGLETDGLAEILLRHQSGVLSNVHLNFLQRDYRRTCQVIGTQGSIYWDFQDGRVSIFDADGALARELPHPPKWESNRMYVDEMEHFLQSAKSTVPTCNPLTGAIAALEIALKVKHTCRM
jgi:predicted dehydrogenase